MIRKGESRATRRGTEIAARLVVFAAGVLLCVYGLAATFFIVVPASILVGMWSGSTPGPVETFGIRIDLYWGIYFPILIALAAGCFILGARRIGAALRRLPPDAKVHDEAGG